MPDRRLTLARRAPGAARGSPCGGRGDAEQALPNRRPPRALAISETCPPGEGIVLSSALGDRQAESESAVQDADDSSSHPAQDGRIRKIETIRVV